jgi:hypothetical protein
LRFSLCCLMLSDLSLKTNELQVAC